MNIRNIAGILFSMVPSPWISSIIGVSSHTALALWSLNALVAVVGALADDACCRYITGFQRMHECFAVYVYEHCAQRTYFLGYQSTEDLSRVSSSGRMVLNGILIQKRSACTVSKDQTVSGCTVMVGCREVVVVKTSRTTCCDDNGFLPLLSGTRQSPCSGEQHLQPVPYRL